MAHPLHHAMSLARRYGDVAQDYQAVHDFFDASKAHMAFFTHRALRHHSQGILAAEENFGLTLTNSAGRQVPVRWIGEQHVKEDCQGRIPSMADWLGRITPAPWMANGVIDNGSPPVIDDPQVAWRQAVADGHTVLGFEDWCTKRDVERAYLDPSGEAA